MTVLIFHIGSLGDTIVTIPLLRAIRDRWPHAHAAMLHNAASRPGLTTPVDVLASTGLVDTFLSYRRHVRGVALIQELARTWWRIRRLGPDVAVFAGPSDRAVNALARDRRFFASAGVGQLVGFDAPAAETGLAASGHEAARKLARFSPGAAPGFAAGCMHAPLLSPDAAAAARVAEWCRTRTTDAARLVAVGTGSLMPAKAWPLDRFVEIGRRLRRAGYEPVAVGGAGERDDASWLVGEWGGGVNAAGIFAVVESAALLARCRAYVGIDSGAAHLAAAVGTPAVVITSGRAPRGRWDPLGDNHIVLRHPTPCEGCGLVACTVAGHPCMEGLPTEAVWEALVSVVGAAPSR